MDVKKVLYISQEITPYLPKNQLSSLCCDLAQGIQELGVEVRTFMPKYGFINERRNQLHEVQRLSGINVIIDDTDHPLIIKVATLLPSRMQVYFIYNEDYFQKTIVKDLETLNDPEQNDERCIFFARSVLETVKKLRWRPDVVHCTGWVTALAPIYIKNLYNDVPEFRETKIVYALTADEQTLVAPLNARIAKNLLADGVPHEILEGLGEENVSYEELTKLAMSQCDGIVQADQDVNPALLEYAQNCGKPFLPFPCEEDYGKTYKEFYQSL